MKSRWRADGPCAVQSLARTSSVHSASHEKPNTASREWPLRAISWPRMTLCWPPARGRDEAIVGPIRAVSFEPIFADRVDRRLPAEARTLAEKALKANVDRVTASTAAHSAGTIVLPISFLDAYNWRCFDQHPGGAAVCEIGVNSVQVLSL